VRGIGSEFTLTAKALLEPIERLIVPFGDSNPRL
jgi:hypothetical protein